VETAVEPNAGPRRLWYPRNHDELVPTVGTREASHGSRLALGGKGIWNETDDRHPAWRWRTLSGIGVMRNRYDEIWRVSGLCQSEAFLQPRSRTTEDDYRVGAPWSVGGWPGEEEGGEYYERGDERGDSDADVSSPPVPRHYAVWTPP
jgi:hypothetical protein